MVGAMVLLVTCSILRHLAAKIAPLVGRRHAGVGGDASSKPGRLLHEEDAGGKLPGSDAKATGVELMPLRQAKSELFSFRAVQRGYCFPDVKALLGCLTGSAEDCSDG